MVDLSDALNSQLHMSFNGVSDSEVEVKLDKSLNTSVHVSFQNPVKTPVKVTMSKPKGSQIHVSQAVPRSSSLKWKLDGNADDNQVHVSQNSADSNSPLDC